MNNPDGDDPEQGDCTQPTAPQTGLAQFGTDPNRNYGGFWGGPGASAGRPAPVGDYAQDYRGDGPFSEPETQNIRDLVSTRQVTTLITNHTFSNLVLRPPGIRSQGPPVDEAIYKALGRRDGRRERLRQPAATSSTTPPAAPRTGPTTRPAAWASRSRSA